MEHYEDSKYNTNCKGDFRSEYSNFLRDPSKRKEPYIDPDGYEKDDGIYKDLTEFLKKQKLILSNAIKRSNEDSTGKIKIELHLTSDQLGFSAPEWREDEKQWKEHPLRCSNPERQVGTYPYGKLLNTNKEEYINLVAECIYETRTLGGSFLWSRVKDQPSQYNRARGTCSYIEDRVDLTLYEIMCFYAVYEKQEPDVDFDAFYEEYKKYYRKNILMKENNSESKVLFEWLSLFGTFEKYVEFFRFEDFVIGHSDSGSKRYVPLDITKSYIDPKDKSRDERLPLALDFDTETKLHTLNSSHRFGLEKITDEDLLQTVRNVKNLVLRRSKRMMENDGD